MPSKSFTMMMMNLEEDTTSFTKEDPLTLVISFAFFFFALLL